ncbi:MAG: hypothetical protein JNJ56_10450 [Ignavibacteria bacterium]|nr:hypothetical protein [Ignavibacteria bacterium]
MISGFIPDAKEVKCGFYYYAELISYFRRVAILNSFINQDLLRRKTPAGWQWGLKLANEP